MSGIGPRPQTFTRKYDHLRAIYAQKLKDCAAAIDNILSQRELGPLGRADVERASQLAHRLAGSGATFGFPDITGAASAVATFLAPVLQGMKTSDVMMERDFAAFRDLMLELRKICVVRAVDDSGDAGDVSYLPHDRTNADARVLVVDDDTDICALIEAKLNLKGMDVDMAHDGAAALDMLAHHYYDMVILDVSMDGMDGQETLRRIKQNPDHLHIPVLMLTGSTQEKDIVHALHAGAMEYIFKPFDPDQLAAKVRKMLSLPRVSVLVIDNDRMILDLLESLYQDKGFHVMLAEDGPQALKALETAHPSLIVLDRQMPEMDGLAVLQDIRRKPGLRDIPVIILSGMSRDKDAVAIMAGGIGAYLTKPFLPEELLRESIDLLERKGIFLDQE